MGALPSGHDQNQTKKKRGNKEWSRLLKRGAVGGKQQKGPLTKLAATKYSRRNTSGPPCPLGSSHLLQNANPQPNLEWMSPKAPPTWAFSGGSDGRRSRDLTIFRRAVDVAACVCAQTRKRSIARPNRCSRAIALTRSWFLAGCGCGADRGLRVVARRVLSCTGRTGRPLRARVSLTVPCRTSGSIC